MNNISVKIIIAWNEIETDIIQLYIWVQYEFSLFVDLDKPSNFFGISSLHLLFLILFLQFRCFPQY